jgi:hypothetical protein
MPSYRMLRGVALVTTDVSEELSAYMIKVTRICEQRNNISREEWCLLACYAVWFL